MLKVDIEGREFTYEKDPAGIYIVVYDEEGRWYGNFQNLGDLAHQVIHRKELKKRGV